MPNYVKNMMQVKGKRAEIAKFKEFVSTKDSELDFDRIVPMPESLNLVSGSATGVAQYAFAQAVRDGDEEMPKGDPKRVKAYMERMYKDIDELYDGRFDSSIIEDAKGLENHGVVLDAETEPRGYYDWLAYGRAYAENTILYGSPTWYEWRIENWGTKWPPSNMYTYKDGGWETYEFNTAWDEPGRIYDALAKKFPKLKFDILYASEDIGANSFHLEYKDGILTKKEYSEDIAIELWGVEKMYNIFDIEWNDLSGGTEYLPEHTAYTEEELIAEGCIESGMKPEGVKEALKKKLSAEYGQEAKDFTYWYGYV